MSINFAVFSLGQASPYFQAIHEARVAAYIVWQVISEVHPFSHSTSTPMELLLFLHHTLAIKD
jgi:hypothetical protein